MPSVSRRGCRPATTAQILDTSVAHGSRDVAMSRLGSGPPCRAESESAQRQGARAEIAWLWPRLRLELAWTATSAAVLTRPFSTGSSSATGRASAPGPRKRAVCPSSSSTSSTRTCDAACSSMASLTLRVGAVACYVPHFSRDSVPQWRRDCGDHQTKHGEQKLLAVSRSHLSDSKRILVLEVDGRDQRAIASDSETAAPGGS